MKQKWLIDVVIAAIAVVALLVWLLCFPPVADAPALSQPTEPTEPGDTYVPNTRSFVGKVLELDGDSVLMECYDKDVFDTAWVNISQTGVTPKVGEEYTVVFEDLVMPSLPPRITAVRMEKA